MGILWSSPRDVLLAFIYETEHLVIPRIQLSIPTGSGRTSPLVTYMAHGHGIHYYHKNMETFPLYAPFGRANQHPRRKHSLQRQLPSRAATRRHSCHLLQVLRTRAVRLADRWRSRHIQRSRCISTPVSDRLSIAATPL